MAKINSILAQRLKQAGEKLSKMTSLAEMSTSGTLSSFSGVFRVSGLSEKEQDALREILSEYCHDDQNIQEDFSNLVTLTTEVKAINNQAAILHGERIKKAQEILKKYRDGAFSAWLVGTYGNRQTPYNFLQYYELYTALPKMLLPKLEEMPRQAVYALASRKGAQEKKEEIIKNYEGQTKQAVLTLIREAFPLASEDRRAQNMAELALQGLNRLNKLFHSRHFKPTAQQKKELDKLLTSFLSALNE